MARVKMRDAALFVSVLVVGLVFALAGAIASRRLAVEGAAATKIPQDAAPLAYLGFDANTYPGDAALPLLKQTFAFSGYWLNAPPGAKENTWIGKLEILRRNGFGFLVLFNGRTERQLKPPNDPAKLGQADAEVAVKSAGREGFPDHTVIFLDQEEGGQIGSRAWWPAIFAQGFTAPGFLSRSEAEIRW
jgi:hypothetical protein